MANQITEHQINECNSAISIEADERDAGNGNASHVYVLGTKDGGPDYCTLRFQHGPIKEVGTNGITHEALLAILCDRLRGFQSGPYACEANELALQHLESAQAALHSRTKERVERGVEGTHAL